MAQTQVVVSETWQENPTRLGGIVFPPRAVPPLTGHSELWENETPGIDAALAEIRRLVEMDKRIGSAVK